MKILSLILLFLPVACSNIKNNKYNTLSTIQSIGYDGNTISETENDDYYKLLLEQVIGANTTNISNNNLILSDVVNVINKRYSKNFSEQHILVIYSMAKEKKIDIIYIIENCFVTSDNKIAL